MSNVFGIIFGVIISLIICLAIVFALYIAYHFGYEASKRPAPPNYQECDPEALPNISTDSRYPPPHHITLHIPASDGNIPIDTVQLDKQTLMTEYYHPVSRTILQQSGEPPKYSQHPHGFYAPAMVQTNTNEGTQVTRPLPAITVTRASQPDFKEVPVLP